MEKQKSVTIKETLFMDLVKYFLVNVREDEDRIRLELQKKLDVLVKRELYTLDSRKHDDEFSSPITKSP